MSERTTKRANGHKPHARKGAAAKAARQDRAAERGGTLAVSTETREGVNVNPLEQGA